MNTLVSRLLAIFEDHKDDAEKRRIRSLEARDEMARRWAEKFVRKLPRLLEEAALKGSTYVEVHLAQTELHFCGEFLVHDSRSAVKQFCDEHGLGLGISHPLAYTHALCVTLPTS